MTRTRILYDNLADYAATVITAASALVSLPVTNLAHPQRTRAYRTGATAAAEWIKLDLGSAKAVQALILLDHTLTSEDTDIVLEANGTDAWETPEYSIPVPYNPGTICVLVTGGRSGAVTDPSGSGAVTDPGANGATTADSTPAYRYWRLRFTKSAAGETRDIGRLFLGPAYECEMDPAAKGWEIKPIDMSSTDRARGGQTYSDVRSQYDEIKLTFPGAASDTFVSALRSLAAAVGTHTPFFVQVLPTKAPYGTLYYCKATKLVGRKVALPTPTGHKWSDLGLELAVEL